MTHTDTRTRTHAQTEYLTVEECRSAGYEPCAVFGGLVYAFLCLGFVIPQGSQDYENVRNDVRANTK